MKQKDADPEVRFTLRLTQAQLKMTDDIRRVAFVDVPSRNETIRRLIVLAFEGIENDRYKRAGNLR